MQTSVFTVGKKVSTCFSLGVGGVGGSGRLMGVFRSGSAARENKTVTVVGGPLRAASAGADVCGRGLSLPWAGPSGSAPTPGAGLRVPSGRLLVAYAPGH